MKMLFGQLPNEDIVGIDGYGFGNWLVDEGYSGVGFGVEDE